MNERIRELLEQADQYAQDDLIQRRKVSAPLYAEGEYDDIIKQKFAELIIRECAQTLRDNTPVLDEYESEEDWDRGYGQAMKDCVHHIQEHFGVEE